MRASILISSLVILVLGLIAVSTLRAQRPAATAPPHCAAGLIDVNVVARDSAKLKKQLETLKAEMDASAARFKQESERGNHLTEKARNLPPNSPERKDLEKQVLKMRADFELEGKRVDQDLHEKESKHLYGMSRELHEELARFAQANNIPLILRFEGTRPELTDPRAILQEIQKPVVYQRELDITPMILEAMNRRAPAQTTAARPGAKPKGVTR